MGFVEPCVKVAVLAPVRQLFDYLLPAGLSASARVGCRVRVPFGRGIRIGIIVALEAEPSTGAKLKPVIEVLDDEALVPPELMALARWASEYYCHPPGEVFATVFPLELRRGEQARDALEEAWSLTDEGAQQLVGEARIGPRQRQVLQLAVAAPLRASTVRDFPFDARRVVRELVGRQWLEVQRLSARRASTGAPEDFLDLNEAQAAAAAAVIAGLNKFSPTLLEGVTGSGKTEVYLHLARTLQASGHQTLVLIPEIGLSEQLVQRFQRRFGDAVALLHSELSDRERALIWERCRSGESGVLVGTRSALWTPLPRLGLIIVDEEHDASFKQQEGFRYSARDVAVMRARQAAIPVLLGSATPSLESEANVARGKYRRLRLPERAGGAVPPTLRGLDVRGLPLSGGLSDALCQAMDRTLARGEQVLLFLNRRGYAPVVLCHACGWIARCSRCDARLVLHREAGKLVCHHCDTTLVLARQPPRCCENPALITLGVGTEQLEEVLRVRFPGRRVLRVDRDSMRRKGQFEAACAAVRNGEVDILLGTQMLTKGHDFPLVTLVGVVDADSRLFATDFRAAERFAQLIMQVAGRAGRGSRPGQVLVQTHHPEHPMLQNVLAHDYPTFARMALDEREAAGLPPFEALAVLRAESTQAETPTQFLAALRRDLKPGLPAEVRLAGPVPATMERRAGKFRALLMLSAMRRSALARALHELLSLIDAAPLRNRVRWHLDIDPEEVG